MKRIYFSLLALLMMASASLLSVQEAQSQGAARDKIFISTVDFPNDALFEHPIVPEKETRFWQLLDRNFRERSSMELTENLEEANYRVNLECAGIVWCTKLKVVLMSPHRDILASYSIPGRPMMIPANLPLMAKRITETLAYRIDSLDRGGMGNFGMTRYRYKYTGGPRKASAASPQRGNSSRVTPQQTNAIRNRVEDLPSGKTVNPINNTLEQQMP